MTAKKPANRRQNRSTSPVVLQSVPSTPLAVPAAPSGLLQWTRHHWDAFWESEVANASGAADEWAVEVFFTALDEWRRCINAARKTPFIEGSTGQMKLNPMYDRADRLMGQLSKLAGEIGASPLARSKLAIEVGNAAKTLEDLTREAQAGDDSDGDDGLAALVESTGPSS